MHLHVTTQFQVDCQDLLETTYCATCIICFTKETSRTWLRRNMIMVSPQPCVRRLQPMQDVAIYSIYSESNSSFENWRSYWHE